MNKCAILTKDFSYFPDFNGLRFIAFLIVFVSHTFKSESIDGTILHDVVEFIKVPGYIGVSFFFTLSGFLISYLLIRENIKLGRINLIQFYKRRILRIWPLYYAVLIVGFLFYPYFASTFISNYSESACLWCYVFFLSNFDNIYNGPPLGIGLGPTWSLSVEEQFYAFWPFIILVLFKANQLKSIIAVLLVIVLLNVLFIIHPFHTFSAIIELFSGALLAFVFIYHRNLFAKLVELSRVKIILLYILGISCIFIYAEANIFAFRLFFIAFFCFILLEQTLCKNSIFKLRRLKYIDYLGKISYGLYMWHMHALLIVYAIFKYVSINEVLKDYLVIPVSGLCLCIVISHISFKYFELPFLRFKYSKDKM